ncbi:hypothetical protein PoB_005101700 [Plakobranchus ocellatus]|uniref:Uncharacterized protein n=1 Tax=Plakobranchus ocellatus TaxID=259542 RepID=A0AAV4BZR3_9GAST|nr:hypothetical protein PoB_005101700 [Plakobranchus ocellatus]
MVDIDNDFDVNINDVNENDHHADDNDDDDDGNAAAAGANHRKPQRIPAVISCHSLSFGHESAGRQPLATELVQALKTSRLGRQRRAQTHDERILADHGVNLLYNCAIKVTECNTRKKQTF